MAACLVTALAFAGPLTGDTPAAPGPTGSRESIVINSVSSNIDYQTNRAEFTDIVISRGDSRLTAERATTTGVDFTNSQWTFRGRVVILSESLGSLRADQAILQFRDGELTHATAIGAPAYIEQASDSVRPQYGHADEITYEGVPHTLRLSGHAQLSDGRNEISAPAFLYNVRDQGWQAISSSEGRDIHIRVLPPGR